MGQIPLTYELSLMPTREKYICEILMSPGNLKVLDSVHLVTIPFERSTQRLLVVNQDRPPHDIEIKKTYKEGCDAS